MQNYDGLRPSDDIFYVEKRLQPGTRKISGLTLGVKPNAEQTGVFLNITVLPVYCFNANELREIASLLNEIADCL